MRIVAKRTLYTMAGRYGDQFPDVGGKRMLRYPMEQRNLRPADLAPVLGGRQVVSDIPRRKGRRLSLANLRALAESFRVSADVFIQPDHDDV